MMYLEEYDSPIGKLTLVSNEHELIAIWIEQQKYFLNHLEHEQIKKENVPVLKRTKNWLDRYFSKKCPCCQELPLSPIGSDFQKSVWKILCTIPYGTVVTYQEIAKKYEEKTGRKTSPRAIGNAVGHNPISIVIPCHRVIGKNGKLTGYAGGIERKKQLLQLEDVTNLLKLF